MNSSTLNRPLIIFGIGTAVAVTALFASISVPEFSFLYFASLLAMVASFVVGKSGKSSITVAQLAVVSLLAMSVPLLRGFGFIAIPGTMLRFLYATDFISKFGGVPAYYPLWESQPYNFWPGSHILLSSIQQLTRMGTEAVYILGGLLTSTLIVIVFYLFVKEATGQNRLAALSAMFIALLKPMVVSRPANSVEAMAYLCAFIALFALIACTRRGGNKSPGFIVVAALAGCGMIVAHHLTSYFFLIALASLAIISLANKQPRASKLVAGYFVFCTIALAAYWIVVAHPFFADMVLGAQSGLEQIASGGVAASGGYVFSEGTLPSWIPIPRSLLPWVSLPPPRSGIGFFNSIFETVGRASSIIFYVGGICAFITILLWRHHRKMMSFFLLWAFILGLAYIVAACTPLGNIFEAPRHIIVSAYPLAVLVSFLTLQAIKAVPRATSSLVYSVVVLVIVIQGITNFPLDVYGLHRIESGSGPLIYSAQDRAVAQWVSDTTQDSAFFLADSRSSQMLLYGAHRRASWDSKGNCRIFRLNVEGYGQREKLLREPFLVHNTRLRTDREFDINYVMLSVYNKTYGAYAVWGSYFNIGKDSVAANIDSIRSVNLVYNDGKSFIYRVLK